MRRLPGTVTVAAGWTKTPECPARGGIRRGRADGTGSRRWASWKPVPLALELDWFGDGRKGGRRRGTPLRRSLGHAYERSLDEAVEKARAVLARTANPEHPTHTVVSRLLSALNLKRAVDTTLTRPFPGLGSVSFLVSGIGVAYTMAISVL